MTDTPGPRRRVALYAIAIAAVIAASGFGIAAGLGTQVLKGGGETGEGSQVSESGPAYWTWTSAIVATIPVAVPGAVSHAAATPTRLPRAFGTNYAINAATTGQTSVAWTFTETTAAPRSSELMITFVDGLSGTATTVVAYLETSARVPFESLTFVFYWDAGTVAPTGLEISSLSETVRSCTAIGVCP